MYKPLFQIYLIFTSAVFAFFAVNLQFFQSYSISNSFFLFLFNLAIAYLVLLSWRGAESRINRKGGSKPVFDILLLTAFVVLSASFLSLAYLGFFRLLFAQNTRLFDISADNQL